MGATRKAIGVCVGLVTAISLSLPAAFAQSEGAQRAAPPLREGSATASGSDVFLNRGLDPSADDWEGVRGEVSLQVRDLTRQPRALRGDEAELTLTIRSGVDRFTLELTETGVPEGAAASPASAFGVRAPVRGGVLLWPEVFGSTGMGPPALPIARAAIALFGVARVTHNGRVLEEAAPVQVFALASGVHADDATNRRLPAARWDDAELIVFAPRVRSDFLPGYLLAVFESPRIEVMGRTVPNAPEVPVTASQLAVGGGGAAGLVPFEEVPGQDGVTPPDFAGAEADLPLSVDPSLEAVPLPETARVANAERAAPLPDAPVVDVGGPRLDTPAQGLSSRPANSSAAAPLPQGVAPLNSTPVARGVPPLPAPVNAQPATPLPPGIPPANAAPASAP